VRQRAISAAVLVPVLLIVLALGGAVLAIAIAIATGLAAIEVFRLLRTAGYAPLFGLGTALALAAVLDAAVPTALEGSGLLLGAMGIVLVAIAAFARPDPHDGLATWIGTIFGALYVSLLAFVIRLGEAAPAIPAGSPLAALGAERAWILLLLLSVWSYDTGAYLVGKRFGRAKFLTHISPSKTYAGLIGGVVATTGVVAIALWAVGQTPWHAIALGPLIALAAQAGDLAESVIKRAAGAKDSGNLIPGHGGILDRVDSFLFAAPVLTLYVVTVLA
jgi:phosphatidate cytidylyltransferase